MSSRVLDNAAAGAGLSSPLWGGARLASINQWLTTALLLLSILFLLWRWWRAALRERRARVQARGADR